MELRLDLHIHSERSFDGCMSLSEIVALARERGLNGVAICDHDRVLDEVPEFDDFLVIPRPRFRPSAGICWVSL
ncbi:MAG: PHP domain-containing protein [Oscillibacter sp.]